MRLVNHLVTLEWVTPTPSIMVERAGRTCYKTEDRVGQNPAAEFLANIIRRGHESVLEHAVASVRIITDKGITHELVRHRIASFSQESTRYCNYAGERFGGSVAFIRPVELPVEAFEVWQEAMEAAERYYLRLLDMKVKPQDARSVLPHAVKTEIVMTANLREWRHFLRLRHAKAAHPDMRVVAGQTYDLLLEHAGDFFPDFPKGGALCG